MARIRTRTRTRTRTISSNLREYFDLRFVVVKRLMCADHAIWSTRTPHKVRAPGLDSTGRRTSLCSPTSLTRLNVHSRRATIHFGRQSIYPTRKAKIYSGMNPVSHSLLPSFSRPLLLTPWSSCSGQVTTKNGNLVITLANEASNGMQYKSGMLQSWNKFCFSSGYIEISAQLPGSSTSVGFVSDLSCPMVVFCWHADIQCVRPSPHHGRPIPTADTSSLHAR